jgi:anti-sigma B factor antagonist
VRRTGRRAAALASRSVGPAPFQASATDLEGGVQLLEVHGELDLSTATQLERPLDEATESEDASVVIDLADCQFIDSTGIALIVRAWQRIDSAAGNGGKGGLVLCCQNEQVRRVLEVTGLEHSLRVFPTREEAVAALRG